MKPTVTWSSRNSMLDNAMMSAINAPTSMAASNPATRLFVIQATTKPAIAVAIRLPFSDRLMTPARSVMGLANTGDDQRSRIGHDASKCVQKFFVHQPNNPLGPEPGNFAESAAALLLRVSRRCLNP